MNLRLSLWIATWLLVGCHKPRPSAVSEFVWNDVCITSAWARIQDYRAKVGNWPGTLSDLKKQYPELQAENGVALLYSPPTTLDGRKIVLATNAAFILEGTGNGKRVSGRILYWSDGAKESVTETEFMAIAGNAVWK